MSEKNESIKKIPSLVVVRLMPEMVAEIEAVKPSDTSMSEFIRNALRTQIKILKTEQKAS